MTATPTIEQLWQSLAGEGRSALFRRVDETHPLELYAELEQPNRPGLVLFCNQKPPEARSLLALRIDQGHRPDGLWWLRLSLYAPVLQPVFAGLCRDIIAFTGSGVTETGAAAAILSRVERWRRLVDDDREGMSALAVKGLIGELVVLESQVLPAFPAFDAVSSWIGPLGAAQDFLLPSGQRIEVKAVRPDARTVQINGLSQLGPGTDPMILLVVRLADAGGEVPTTLTAPKIIDRLRRRLSEEPQALNEFESRLAAVGWHEHLGHANIAVRVEAIDQHVVESDFPRLTSKTVPCGVVEADYTIMLPALRPAMGGNTR
jgi:Putative  PD-(D/E)XK family member, (DUF4420)